MEHPETDQELLDDDNFLTSMRMVGYSAAICALLTLPLVVVSGERYKIREPSPIEVAVDSAMADCKTQLQMSRIHDQTPNNPAFQSLRVSSGRFQALECHRLFNAGNATNYLLTSYRSKA